MVVITSTWWRRRNHPDENESADKVPEAQITEDRRVRGDVPGAHPQQPEHEQRDHQRRHPRGLPIFTGWRLSPGDESLRRERDSGTRSTLPRRTLVT